MGHGDMDGTYGYWVEDDESGEVGFLPEVEDVFWTYDEINDVWNSHYFKGRRLRRGPAKRKGKGKGSSGRRRFNTQRKGKGKGSHSHMTKESDSARMAMGKGRKPKGKGKGKDKRAGNPFADR